METDMVNSTDRMANDKARRDTAAKASERALLASVVSGLQSVIAKDEQLLGFARGVISGGFKNKLSLGPEAFFAPLINIGLTDTRILLQHLHAESGRPGEILPHTLPLGDIASVTYSDIETFGAEPASRLVVQLVNGQSFRLRVRGEDSGAGALALADVFKSISSNRARSFTNPTQSQCGSCNHILDAPARFCPYCGAAQQKEAKPSVPTDIFVETPVSVEVPASNSSAAASPIESAPPTAPEAASAVEGMEPIDAAEAPLADQEAPESAFFEVQEAEDAPEIEVIFDPANETSREIDLDIETETETEIEPKFNNEPEIDVDTSPATAVVTTEPVVDELAAPADTILAEPAIVQHTETESEIEQETAVTTDASIASEVEPAPEAEPVTAAQAEHVVGQQPQEPAAQTVITDENRNIRLHFHVQHTLVKFSEIVSGRNAEEVVSNLKVLAVNQLKFPIKLHIMRMTPLEFAQEIVNRYNLAEHKNLPQPRTCLEFLNQAVAIGYAKLPAS